MTFINDICDDHTSCEVWLFMVTLLLLAAAIIFVFVGLVFLCMRLIYRLMYPSGKEPTDQNDYQTLEEGGEKK